MLGEKKRKLLSSIELSCKKKKKNKKATAGQIHQRPTASSKMKPVASPDSFLPPHFGLLDRPEVRVVDHAVLIDL